MKIEQLKKELHKLQHFVLNKAQNDNFTSFDEQRLLDGIKTIQCTVNFINDIEEYFCEREVEDE